MDGELQQKLATAVWIARSLFERGKTAGSTANLSFRHNDAIYITGSGTCFGTLTGEQFAAVAADGTVPGKMAPSKELPLHKILYDKDGGIGAVIHTHSFYSTLWSCLVHGDPADIVPDYTPYLKMKVGTIGLIPYAKPGSQELFAAFAARVNRSEGYILQNHGLIVGGAGLMEAFFAAEELEESAKIAWHLRNEKARTI
jgi:ribulose-5-phosphate 4-epimerase/fuculose-1-phosphate aldolase